MGSSRLGTFDDLAPNLFIPGSTAIRRLQLDDVPPRITIGGRASFRAESRQCSDGIHAAHRK
jgi:hypothetical protein